jgi:hypothetical protein
MTTHPVRITIDMVPGYSPRAITNTLTAADLDVVEHGSTRCEATGSLTDSQFTALCLELYRAECVRSFTVHNTPR